MKLYFVSLLATIFILALSQSIKGQDSVLFIDGDFLILSQYKFDDEAKLLLYHTRRGKVKEEELSEVYSITHADGSIEIYYVPDTSKNDFSVQEMKRFISGEQEAMKNYRAPGIFISSTAVGVLSPLPLGPYFSIAATSGIPIVSSFVPLNEKRFRKHYPEVEDVHYTAGYLKKAENLRIKIAFKGAGIGFAVGFAAMLVFAYSYSPSN